MPEVLERAPGMAEKHWGRRGFLLLFLAATGAAAAALQRHIDPDLFWHLRAGQDILDAGRVVLPDAWNYLFEGHPWVNQQWLTQLLFCGFFRAGGYAGLEILKGLLVSLMALFALGALATHSTPVRFACAALFVVCTLHYFIFRTHLMSLLCTAVLVFLLERIAARSRLPWLILLFALWANLHALFGLGLMVLGLWILVVWVQEGMRMDARALWAWASVPLCSLATLANPYGWGVWQTAITAFSDPETRLVTEWWPIWRHSIDQSLGFLFLVALVGVLTALFPRQIHWPSLVAASALAVLGVLHVRFTASVSLPALPLVASLLTAFSERLGRNRIEVVVRDSVPTLTGMLAVFTAACLAFLAAHPLVTPGDRLRMDYPVRAVRWMRDSVPPGRVFNEYTWGGFLALELPRWKTVIDPRTGVLLFPRGFVGKWKEAVETRPGWRDTLERGRPDYVLVVPDNYLSAQLAEEPGWELLFQDSVSTLYGRRKSKPGAGVADEEGACVKMRVGAR